LNETPLSVTDLETYGTCPFKFMAGSMLGLRSPSEYLDDISAIERGFVLHDVLFEFFRSRRARGLPPVSRLPDREFEEAVKELEGMAERRLDRLDIPGPFWELERDYILGTDGRGLLRSFLEVERERTDRMRPGFFEVAFGQPGNRPGSADPSLSTPASVRIGKMHLRGRIDRLDVGEECFVVIDYKTGSLLPTFADIRSGRSLQLPLYMRAAAELLAGEGEAMEPAAGLYYQLREPVALKLALGSAAYGDIAFTQPRASRRVFKTQEELLEVIEAAVERANAYVEAMRHGLFPLTPPEHRETACRYCEFKTICRVTTVRQEPYDHQEDQ
jgi:ATP-dependent helicase/nuclease subunit B